MSKRKFIDVRSMGYGEEDRLPPDTPTILISFYGVKGGTRAIEALSIEAATNLRDKLNEVLKP